MFTAPVIVAAALALAPYLAAAFAPEAVFAAPGRLPKPLRLLGPALLAVPYALVSISARMFAWRSLALYALLPVAFAVLLDRASRVDPDQRGDWRDFLVLAVVGTAVDLRWFQPAWPARLDVFNKILLLDACLYAFFAVRRLDGAGFNLRLGWSDLGVGLREFLFYAPVALVVGFGLGFLHWRPAWPDARRAALAWVFTFFFVAVPEEVFFRGWIENLLERRMGRKRALLLTAALFGLSHWNKRTLGFNWRYVILAAIAGTFYGRAWRANRRVGASAITHACVDTVWGLWFR